MSKIVRSIVITGNGTNCEVEMAHACRLAGADVVDIVHISELLAGEKRLDDYDFLNLPGGFLDGDDLGAAKAGANRIRHAAISGTEEKLYDQMTRFIRDGKLILGVCNGFQLLVKLGLLPGCDGDYQTQTATLSYNDSGRFEDRWVHLAVNPASPCIFTRGLTQLYLPVRHGEGKFIPRDETIRARLHRDGHVALQYCPPPGGQVFKISVFPPGDTHGQTKKGGATAPASASTSSAGIASPTGIDSRSGIDSPSGSASTLGPAAILGTAAIHAPTCTGGATATTPAASGAPGASPVAYPVASGPTMTYPDNPNGSVDAIAGICNATGRIFGLMPHPEAFLHRTNHPRWTREDLPEAGQGLAIFQNAVAFARNK